MTNSKNQNLTTEKLTFLSNSKTENVSSRTQIMTKPKLWENSKTKIMKKLKKNSNCEKTQTQIVTKLKNSTPDNAISDNTLTNLLVRTTWHLDNPWDVLWAMFCNLAMFNRPGVAGAVLLTASWFIH